MVKMGPPLRIQHHQTKGGSTDLPLSHALPSFLWNYPPLLSFSFPFPSSSAEYTQLLRYTRFYSFLL